MAVSDEELQAKRDRVQTLREQIAETQASTQTEAALAANDVAAAQLDAEAARLEQELADAQVVADAQPDQIDAQVAAVSGGDVQPDKGALASLRAGEERNAQLEREQAQAGGQASTPVSTTTAAPTGSGPTSVATSSVASPSTPPSDQGA